MGAGRGPPDRQGGRAIKRTLAAIVAADMVGYSRLMDTDQQRAIAQVRSLRERWLEPKTADRGGKVLKRMGDGWLIAFDSASDAVEAAMSVQQGLSTQSEIKIRVAAHVGELIDDGTDYYGPGLNIASRLQVEAPPGGVMISDGLYRQLDPSLGRVFAEAGTFALKNIARPVATFLWRPEHRRAAVPDELPTIALDRVATDPGAVELAQAAEGLGEELMHRLSRRTGIRVRAPGGAAAEGGAPTYRLRGSLRPRGAGLRLTLTLLKCADGEVVWSDAFDGGAGEAAALCDRAAERADNDLRLAINAFDGDRLAALPDDELSASELRTRAAQCIYRCTPDALRRALSLIERAIDLDPDNGMGLAMWSEVSLLLVLAGFDAADGPVLRRIADLADRAVTAAPRSDYVFYVRALVRARLLRDVEGARRDIRRMEQINPGYALRFEAEGFAEFVAGHGAASAAAFRRCNELTARDPYLPTRIYACALALLMAGDPGGAIRTIEEAIEVHRECRAYWQVLADARAAAGDHAAALEARQMAERLPDRPNLLAQRPALDA